MTKKAFFLFLDTLVDKIEKTRIHLHLCAYIEIREVGKRRICCEFDPWRCLGYGIRWSRVLRLSSELASYLSHLLIHFSIGTLHSCLFLLALNSNELKFGWYVGMASWIFYPIRTWNNVVLDKIEWLVEHGIGISRLMK